MNNMRESDRNVGLGLNRDGHHRPFTPNRKKTERKLIVLINWHVILFDSYITDVGYVDY